MDAGDGKQAMYRDIADENHAQTMPCNAKRTMAQQSQSNFNGSLSSKQ
jgi:hypothetical protein